MSNKTIDMLRGSKLISNAIGIATIPLSGRSYERWTTS